jgi:cysteine desulfurase
MNRNVYLDNHATTPVDPRVLEAMLPYFTDSFGNAASRTHALVGRQAAPLPMRAHPWLVSSAPRAGGDRLYFRATESNNLAIKGALEYHTGKGKPRHHHRGRAQERARHRAPVRMRGAEVTIVGVIRRVRVDPQENASAITPKTVLASVMLANNEVGTVQPIAEIGSLLHSHGVFVARGRRAGRGRVDFDVQRMTSVLASLSAHKIYGPKGLRALYVRRSRPRVRLTPQMDGGGHERGMRSGTLNVPGIVAFGARASY